MFYSLLLTVFVGAQVPPNSSTEATVGAPAFSEPPAQPDVMTITSERKGVKLNESRDDAGQKDSSKKTKKHEKPKPPPAAP